jgi:hypothetical protein
MRQVRIAPAEALIYKGYVIPPGVSQDHSVAH